jgi:co-chaperonin GroES (HSP10)
MYNQLSPEQEERKQALLAAIEQIPLTEGFKLPQGFPVPLGDYIIVKIVEGNSGIQETEAGILLTSSIAKNTSVGVTGIIYSAGYACSEFIIPGQKVMINEYADFEIMIKGVLYRKIQERDIHGILPPDSWLYKPVKSDRQLLREERKDQFANYAKVTKAMEENEKDKKSSKKK